MADPRVCEDMLSQSFAIMAVTVWCSSLARLDVKTTKSGQNRAYPTCSQWYVEQAKACSGLLTQLRCAKVMGPFAHSTPPARAASGTLIMHFSIDSERVSLLHQRSCRNSELDYHAGAMRLACGQDHCKDAPLPRSLFLQDHTMSSLLEVDMQAQKHALQQHGLAQEQPWSRHRCLI